MSLIRQYGVTEEATTRFTVLHTTGADAIVECGADEEGRCDIPRVFFSLESTEFLHTAGVNCLCAPKAHFPIHAHIPGLEKTNDGMTSRGCWEGYAVKRKECGTNG